MGKLPCKSIVKVQYLCLHSFSLSVPDVQLAKVTFNMMICKTGEKNSFYSTALSCGHAGGTREQNEVQLNKDNILYMQVLMLCCDKSSHFHTSGLFVHILPIAKEEIFEKQISISYPKVTLAAYQKPQHQTFSVCLPHRFF